VKITKIKLQKNQKQFNIYLDGKFAFALSAETLAKMDLKVDQEISEKEIEKLKYKDIRDRLYNQSLRFLSYRPRSKKEIRDYLKKKSEKAEIIGGIIKKLEKQSLIDDRAFVAWWIEQRSRFRPRGRYLLWSELLKKGIEKEAIETSLSSEKEELRLARKAARKKVKSYRNLEPLEFRQKMIGFLSRRGFGWETIKKTLAEILKKRYTKKVR